MDYDAIIKYPTYEEGFALWIRIEAKKKVYLGWKQGSSSRIFMN